MCFQNQMRIADQWKYNISAHHSLNQFNKNKVDTNNMQAWHTQCCCPGRCGGGIGSAGLGWFSRVYYWHTSGHAEVALFSLHTDGWQQLFLHCLHQLCYLLLLCMYLWLGYCPYFIICCPLHSTSPAWSVDTSFACSAGEITWPPKS